MSSVSAKGLFAALPFNIAEREIAAARKLLPSWSADSFAVRQLAEEQGPGNVLLLEASFEHSTEIATGFRKLGVSAESLAKTAAHRIIGSEAFAGPYLAHQLLLPFALAGGGRFTTVKPSQHARIAAAVIERFTGQRWTFERQADGCHLVRLHEDAATAYDGYAPMQVVPPVETPTRKLPFTGISVYKGSRSAGLQAFGCCLDDRIG